MGVRTTRLALALGLGLVATGAAQPGCPPGAHAETERAWGLDLSWCENPTTSLRPGTWRAAYRQGAFRAAYPQGGRAVEGSYSDGIPSGAWSAWHEGDRLAWRGHYGSPGADGSRNPRSGRPVVWPLRGPPDGPMDGVWELWYEDGTRQRVATYRAGKLHGRLEDWRPDGTIYQRAEYANGDLEGLRESWHSSGKRAEVEHFEAGKRAGAWQSFYFDGRPRERGEYVAGNRQGVWTTWHATGNKKSEGRYEAGRRVGEWRTYHLNGAPRTVEHYTAGKLDGELREWHFDGVLSRHESYENGRRTRSEQVEDYDPYHPNGSSATLKDLLASGERRVLFGWGTSCPEGAHAVERLSIGRFKDKGCVDELDRRQGVWTGEYRKGRKRFEHSYRDGQLEGLLREWWENGQLAIETSFEGGLPHGAFREWGWFGSPRTSGRFERGRPVGTWQSWRELGVPEAKVELSETGELLSWETWNEVGTLIEQGESAAKGTYRFRRFDESTGYPRLVIETSAELYHRQEQLPSEHVVSRPGVRVELTGLATERDHLGQLLARGRYVEGSRDGDWDFPREGRIRSYRNGAIVER